MPENFAFYSATYDQLPDARMRELAGDSRFSTQRGDDGGRSFVYRWPNVTVTCNEMPAKQVLGHLEGFAGYVLNLYQGRLDQRGVQILERIRHTRLVVGVIVEPERDPEDKAEELVGAMCNGLDALMFFEGALYDQNAKLILGPDRSFAEEADILGPVADLIRDRVVVEANPEWLFEPAPTQKARYDRVLAELRRRRVPTLSYALCVSDDSETQMRPAEEVSQRVLALWAVTLLADGMPRVDVQRLIEKQRIEAAFSPEEREFLAPAEMDPDQAHQLLWRLESLWVLLWAIGDLDVLDWPAGMCDVPRLSQLMKKHEANPEFVGQCRLRSHAEIIDAAQLVLLLHWTIRESWIHQRPVPEDLDWTSSSTMVAVSACAAVPVVEQRHHALNWLIGDDDWDNVDTGT